MWEFVNSKRLKPNNSGVKLNETVNRIFLQEMFINKPVSFSILHNNISQLLSLRREHKYSYKRVYSSVLFYCCCSYFLSHGWYWVYWITNSCISLVSLLVARCCCCSLAYFSREILSKISFISRGAKAILCMAHSKYMGSDAIMC